MATKAAFQIQNYFFKKVIIDLDNRASTINVDFKPSGTFDSEDSTYELKFEFIAFGEDNRENPFVLIECIGVFKFENVLTLEDIPSFFYRNAIALLFPYLRAFTSMVTVQANIPPLILPTYNLADLEEPLKSSTTNK